MKLKVWFVGIHARDVRSGVWGSWWREKMNFKSNLENYAYCAPNRETATMLLLLKYDFYFLLIVLQWNILCFSSQSSEKSENAVEQAGKKSKQIAVEICSSWIGSRIFTLLVGIGNIVHKNFWQSNNIEQTGKVMALKWVKFYHFSSNTNIFITVSQKF